MCESEKPTCLLQTDTGPLPSSHGEVSLCLPALSRGGALTGYQAQVQQLPRPAFKTLTVGEVATSKDRRLSHPSPPCSEEARASCVGKATWTERGPAKPGLPSCPSLSVPRSPAQWSVQMTSALASLWLQPHVRPQVRTQRSPVNPQDQE